MKILDKILRQRLEKIRDELNLYIAEHTFGGITEKCLNTMPLNDEDDVEDFEFDNEDSDIPKEPLLRPSAPARTMSTPQPAFSTRPVELTVPEFLRPQGIKRTIDEVLETKEETFSSMLLRMIDEKGLKDSDVYKKANIDRRLFSKIRGDEDYVPSKKTAISFCLALQLEMEEAKKLLEAAGYALSTSSKFDLIIMYLIENREYSIHFANIVLEDYGQGTLSK